MSSYGPLLMPPYYLLVLHRGLQAIIIQQLPLITNMTCYYTWSFKYSPSHKSRQTANKKIKWKKRNKAEKQKKQTRRGLVALPNPFWCLEQGAGLETQKASLSVLMWELMSACRHTHTPGDPSQSKGTLVMQLLLFSSPNCTPNP